MIMSIANTNPFSPRGKEMQDFSKLIKHILLLFSCGTPSHRPQPRSPQYSRERSLCNLVVEEENISFSSKIMRVSTTVVKPPVLHKESKNDIDFLITVVR